LRLKLRTRLPIDLVLVSAASLMTFYLLNFHSQLWQHVSLKEGARLIKEISITALIFLGALYYIQNTRMQIGKIVSSLRIWP